MNDFLATSLWLSLVCAFIGGLITSRWIFGPAARALSQRSRHADDERDLAQDMHGQVAYRHGQGLPMLATGSEDPKADEKMASLSDRNQFLQDGIDLGLWPIGQVKK